MRRSIIILLASFVLTGCVTSGHQKFYRPDEQIASHPDVELLREGQTPTIYASQDLDRDEKILVSRSYIRIGYSSFNGALEGQEAVSAQARRVGASVVLVKSQYTDTQTTTIPLFVPNTATTYGSGTMFGYGGSATYYGSSTTYGTAVVPMTTQHRRHDQVALYFAKLNRKFKYGLLVVELPPEARAAIQRNTAALIEIVMEQSPAFYANILPGDILLAVDGKEVRSATHAVEVMAATIPSRGKNTLTILRSGEEKVVSIDLARER
jgi:serine protease Do